MAAAKTLVAMTTESCRSATGYRIEHLAMLMGKMRAV